MKMFRAGASDPVAGSDLFTCVTIQDKTKCQGFSSMMMRCISREINTFQRVTWPLPYYLFDYHAVMNTFI